MMDQQLAALRAMGELENRVHELADIQEQLEDLSTWQPAHGLAKQAVEARKWIAGMQMRMDQQLVVTLVGPSGAGKSTLLNALAGVDQLSPMGLQRPTTKDLVVLANNPDSARSLFEPLSSDQVRIQSSPRAEMLSHVMLVDTPDTDSVERDSHLDLLYAIIERSDVLLCVFDAQNPKRRDHADFLAPLVRRFHGASLVAVLNKCDRLAAQELSETIKPDFETYLSQAWDTVPQALFMLSARSHLQNPHWDDQARPRHDLDQFKDLRKLIFEAFNQADFGPDRRLANAARLTAYIQDQVSQTAKQDQAPLTKALDNIKAARRQALLKVLESLRADDRRQMLGVNVRFYQALAQRWLGPVGWLVAIWSRLTVFGSGLTALVRFGNPVAQVWGLVSTWQRYRKSKDALAALKDQTRLDRAMQTFDAAWMVHWPDIAELLIKGRFNPSIRNLATDDEDQLGRTLDQLWAEALDKEINRWARRLSHPLLQIVFNLPSVVLMGYVGWLTATGFFTGAYLVTDFFIHALLTIVVVLLLTFFLLQIIVRLVLSRDRIQSSAFKDMQSEASDRPPAYGARLYDQVEKILAMADKEQ